MAEAIALAIRTRGQLLAEAGTGTGKTFAYLVPALLSGGKVIISTGTKTLQDQLYQRDLPLVRDALRIPITVALLKGRGNYVCHHHLARTAAQPTFASRADIGYVKRIESFVRTSESGDKSEVADVPENAAIWADVTSTRENCLGTDCGHYNECFVMNARKQALAADVVVINHHLFFADVMLKDEGIAELLPASNTVILDEAHQLPETATLFFGEEVTGGQLGELARDAELEGLKAARDYAPLPAAAQALGLALRRFRLAAGETPGKLPRALAMRRPGFDEALDALDAALAAVAVELGKQAERSDDLAQCAHRADDALARLARWRDHDDPEWIRWLDVSASGWQLRASPLSVAEIFAKQVTDHARAWIFTSATLAIGSDFSLYQRELGLGEAATGPAVFAARIARTEQLRAHRCGRRGRATRAEGQRRSRLFAVHDAPRTGPRARIAGGSLQTRRDRFSAAGARRGFTHRIAYPFPPPGQRRLVGQPELLGGRRCARRSLVGGDHRQAAVRSARRSAACCAARAYRAPGRQSVLRLSIAASGDQPQAGRGQVDPLGDRPRRPDDLRPAAGRQAVWPSHLASAAADAAHPRVG
jgi:hypothetical protein